MSEREILHPVEIILLGVFTLTLFVSGPGQAERTAWNELPRKGWEEDAREIKGLKGPKQVCIGYPPSQASQLTFASAESFPARAL